ncbi:MAG: SpoIIE family protein phosphatase [Acidimicrobiaceae bacterium]|nr:SpoIIE family protein phosphatase [Acidimicrobiaceae bacterium]
MGSLRLTDEGRSGPVDWAVAARALPGEPLSGDAHVVVSDADQVTLAVIDGLGHGPIAAQAADIAVQTIRGLPGERIEVILERCHQALSKSRGAAITCLQVGLVDGSATWLGVGNVDAWILRRDVVGTLARESALPAGGVVGLQMPALRPRSVRLRGGDVIIMVTDGVAPSWIEAVRPGRPPAATARHILDDHCRPGDDALVLAARYRGVR